jgi:threonine dehydrogenase-like Zn-dependent dehydrogenase
MVQKMFGSRGFPILKLNIQAPEAYKKFDEREQGWTKVILHPR